MMGKASSTSSITSKAPSGKVNSDGERAGSTCAGLITKVVMSPATKKQVPSTQRTAGSLCTILLLAAPSSIISRYPGLSPVFFTMERVVVAKMVSPMAQTTAHIHVRTKLCSSGECDGGGGTASLCHADLIVLKQIARTMHASAATAALLPHENLPRWSDCVGLTLATETWR